MESIFCLFLGLCFISLSNALIYRFSWMVFEYTLNNSSFTADQWAAINSGATTANIGQITTNENAISTINNTLGTFGDIVTHNASEFAPASSGSLATTALQPGDDITQLTNNANFISGIDSTDVVTALGYTPYSSSNPDGFINSSAVGAINKRIKVGDIVSLKSGAKWSTGSSMATVSISYAVRMHLSRIVCCAATMTASLSR